MDWADNPEVLTIEPSAELAKRDPRRLRMLMDRAADLVREHELKAVFVGIAGKEGDLLAPEFIAFVESALRVEDCVFSMTRERAVLLLTDVSGAQAESILSRVSGDFRDRFPSSTELDIQVRFHEVSGPTAHPTAKEILPLLFSQGKSLQLS